MSIFLPIIHGHSLDVMIFSNRCDVLSVSPSDAISDHFSVVADLKILTDHSHTVPQTITYRKLKAINMEAFKADINNSDLIKNPTSNATKLAQQYDSVLSTVIDFHAPLATKTDLPQNLLTRGWLLPSWLPKDIVDTLSASGVRYPTAQNRSTFSKQIHLCNKQMSKAKSAHYSKIMAEHSGEYRSFWQAFNKISHRCPKNVPPRSFLYYSISKYLQFSFHK